MSQPVLLDTCAAIWVANAQALRGDAQQVLAAAEEAGGGIFVSPITAWEIGVLVSRGRVTLSRDPDAWFAALLRGGFVLAPMPPEVLMAASFLPDCALRDPADRILAATARAFGYQLMTRDQPLLEYASMGHLDAVTC